MAMTQDSIVVGVFQDLAQARRAIDELKQAGYSENETFFIVQATCESPAQAY